MSRLVGIRNPIIPDLTRDVFVPVILCRKASLSGLLTAQPERKRRHPKGRREAEEARSALTTLERRLLRVSNLPEFHPQILRKTPI